MKTTNYGEVIVDTKDIFEALYNGVDIDFANCKFDNADAIKAFNLAVSANADNIPKLIEYTEPNFTLEAFDENNQSQWFMPKEYKDFNIENWLLCQAQDVTALNRVKEELVLFRQHNMITLLKYIKYLVDTMRKNSIVWGVGRGSSVASYVLYLLGIHKVDSIRYNLDIREFLKETENV